MKQTIAVDIDEVLARHNHGLAKYYNKLYGTNHTEHDYFTEHWSKVWNVSHEEAEKRAAAFHEAGEHAFLEVVPDAFEVLLHLKKRFRLVVVTVRRKQIISITHKWLDTFYPALFADVHFVHIWEDANAKSKAEICEEVDANWLIDDSLKHTSKMAERGRKGLLFGDYTWNRSEALPDGVTRLRAWQDVKEYFEGV